jgi:hypothetical protein
MNRRGQSIVDRSMKYLAQMAMNHNVDPHKFFDCIVEAWKSERSKCERLKITCREKRENSGEAVFLFTQGSDIIAQFPISIKTLEGNHQLEDYVAAIPPVRARRSIKKDVRGVFKIEELKPEMKGFNLAAKVVEVSEPNIVRSRVGPVRVSNVLIADETGTIKLVLWNKHIDMVSEGALIEISNAKVGYFRGELMVRVGKGNLKLLERSKEM